MKNLFVFVGILALLTSFSSCEQMEVDLQEPTPKEFISETIQKEDAILLRMLTLQNQLLDQSTNLKEIRRLTSQDELSREETQKLLRLMGFQNMDEYLMFELELKEAAEDMISLPFIESEEETEQRFKLVIEKELVFSKSECNCAARFTVCLASVAAKAFRLHTACLAADWTGIGGLLCHGTAVGLQAAGSYGCHVARQQCNDNC